MTDQTQMSKFRDLAQWHPAGTLFFEASENAWWRTDAEGELHYTSYDLPPREYHVPHIIVNMDRL